MLLASLFFMLHRIATTFIHLLSKLQKSWIKERSQALRLLEHHKLSYQIESGTNEDCIYIKKYKQSFILRHESSDFITFTQVIIGEEYDWLMNLLKTVFKADLKYIIDAGANIGLASLVFNRYFPEAQICALEPEDKNFASLKQNLESNRISANSVINGGLWSKSCNLEVKQDFRDGRDWSFSVAENPDGSVQAYGIEELIEKVKFPTIDLLKIDIEGSEFEVLKTSFNWIKKVKFLAIEIHEEFGTVEQIHQLIGDEFEYLKVNETYLFFRKSKN